MPPLEPALAGAKGLLIATLSPEGSVACSGPLRGSTFRRLNASGAFSPIPLSLGQTGEGRASLAVAGVKGYASSPSWRGVARYPTPTPPPPGANHRNASTRRGIVWGPFPFPPSFSSYLTSPLFKIRQAGFPRKDRNKQGKGMRDERYEE